MLLGLLTELQGIVVHPFRFCLAVPLHPHPLLADLFEFGHCLLAVAVVLLEQLAVALGGFLFKLLATNRKLLLHLGHAGLVLLFSLGNLLAGLDQ